MNRFIRIRFSLATLFVVVCFMATAAAAYGYHLRALQRQDAAFHRLAALGGEVHVRVEGTSVQFGQRGVFCGSGLKRVVEATTASPSQLEPMDLAVLNGVLKLKFVDFGTAGISRSALEELRKRHPQCKFYQNDQEL
jgi:hypothetical protein